MIKYIIIRFLNAVEILLLIRIVLSWLPIGRNPFTDFIYTVTEPILAPARRLIEKSMNGRYMMVDFSPIVAFLILRLLARIILSI